MSRREAAHEARALGFRSVVDREGHYEPLVTWAKRKGGSVVLAFDGAQPCGKGWTLTEKGWRWYLSGRATR